MYHIAGKYSRQFFRKQGEQSSRNQTEGEEAQENHQEGLFKIGHSSKRDAFAPDNIEKEKGDQGENCQGNLQEDHQTLPAQATSDSSGKPGPSGCDQHPGSHSPAYDQLIPAESSQELPDQHKLGQHRGKSQKQDRIFNSLVQNTPAIC